MTVYDDADRRDEIWKRRGLHWHCHMSRMDGDAYNDEPGRRDPATGLAPFLIREWPRKPAWTIKAVAFTPDEAVQWLRKQWGPVRWQIGEEAAAIPDETRFGTALSDLRGGNDVCWGFWLGPSVHLHLAAVGTDRGCHVPDG